MTKEIQNPNDETVVRNPFDVILTESTKRLILTAESVSCQPAASAIPAMVGNPVIEAPVKIPATVEDGGLARASKPRGLSPW